MKEDNNPTAKKDVSWVTNRNSNGYTFFAKTLVIDAPIDEVWALEKDVKQYEELSDHTVRAEVQGELAVDKEIRLDLFTNECFGQMIPTSSERISIIDDDNKILGWERKLPLLDKPTERYAVLEKNPDNPRQTIAHIGLKIPGYIGFFTSLFMKSKLEEAFDKLNTGIKNEAERHNQSKL